MFWTAAMPWLRGAWSTIALCTKKAWAEIREVPAWIWVIVVLALALLLIRKRMRHRSVGEIKKARRDAWGDYLEAATDIQVRRNAKVEKAVEAHQKAVATIEEKDESLIAAAGDVDAVADAVNDAFRREP